MNQKTAETLDEHQADAKIIVRAKRAYKTRCSRNQTAPESNPEWTIEQHGSQTSVVMRSAGVIQVEYSWEWDTLRHVADGPARAGDHEKAELASVEGLLGENLVAKALQCLHALNRAAKQIAAVYTRDGDGSIDFCVSRAPAVGQIYDLKDRFLEAMVLSARASLGTFLFERETKSVWCFQCSRTWFGDRWCRSCRDDSGVPDTQEEQWYLVDCGSGYRFHRPTVSRALEALATPISPHDPTQERREIPDVGLGRVAQMRCVERAIEFVLTTVAKPTKETSACSSDCATRDLAS